MQDLLSSEDHKTSDAGRRADRSTSGGDAQNGPTATTSRRHDISSAPSVTAVPSTSSSVSARRRQEAPTNNVDRLLADVQGALQRHGQRLMLRDYLDTLRLEWQELALIVDRTLLLAFVLITFGATAIILLQAPLSMEFLFGHKPDHTEAED